MAKLSYASIENQPANTSENTGNTTGVKFFALKDGESAVVRILCDSVDDIDIYTVHNVVTQQWQFGRRMSCLRDPHDPIEACPLCAANKPLMQKMYVRMIQYVTDPQTSQIVPTPVIWERGVNDKQFGARILASYLEAFGPLSNILFKFTRSGEKLNTTYQIIPNLPANVFPENLYPNVANIFGDYTPAGRAFIDRSADDYRVFLATGNFPNPNAQATPKVEPSANTPEYGNGFANTAGAANAYNAPTPAAYGNAGNTAAPAGGYNPPVTNNFQPANNAAPVRETLPWENPNTAASASNVGFDRPVRRY